MHLMIHDHDDVRGALKPGANGRAARRPTHASQRSPARGVGTSGAYAPSLPPCLVLAAGVGVAVAVSWRWPGVAPPTATGACADRGGAIPWNKI